MSCIVLVAGNTAMSGRHVLRSFGAYILVKRQTIKKERKLKEGGVLYRPQTRKKGREREKRWR